MAHCEKCRMDIKPSFDPCCGYPLITGARCVAYFTMFLSFVGLMWFGCMLIYFLATGGVQPSAEEQIILNPEQISTLDTLSDWNFIIASILKLAFALTVLIMSTFLSRAVDERNYSRLQRWIQANLALIAGLISVAFIQWSSGERPVLSVSSAIYLSYGTWIVNGFRNEVGLDSLIEKTLLPENTHLIRPLFFSRL